MTKLTRRSFARLCGGTLAAQSVLSTWPAWATIHGQTSAAPDAADTLVALTLTEASARIHARTVTSTQLTQALIARIKIYNPIVNAYITVMTDDALHQAAELDAEQKAGKFRGPLHGIPIALKDNIDTAGTRTTAASPMFKDR